LLTTYYLLPTTYYLLLTIMVFPIKLHTILGVEEKLLRDLDARMVSVSGKKGVIEALEDSITQLIRKKLKGMNLPENAMADEVLRGLFDQVSAHEKELYAHIGITPKDFDFDKIAAAAHKISTKEEGFFLKREYADKILKQRPPQEAMKHLGYKNVEELLAKEDVREVFSALRFIESDEWMHETFQVAYTQFTPDDFEERAVEVRVLGDQWADIAQKFVAKKHHNVSHLKEFGIIFLNPIAQTDPGSFIRDFALLLHYFHEISFYSKLFKYYSKSKNFNEHFISLLRGDVSEAADAGPGEWLIVQRYLWKEDPQDRRLFLPHVNPEALHWRNAELDMVAFGKQNSGSGLDFWEDLDFVGHYFPLDGHGKEFISFDLEDVAMSYVAAHQNLETRFAYHQKEALWNKLFADYMGGYKELERFIIQDMGKGVIKF
ncbi:MAG: hypothetical protein WD712_02315, partial [Candidatus Spechtbacterales bacterium]